MSVNPVSLLFVFLLLKYNMFHKKCVAGQRKSNLYDRAALFYEEKGGMETRWQRETR